MRPIANKYCEGNLKRNSKELLKSTWNLIKSKGDGKRKGRRGSKVGVILFGTSLLTHKKDNLKDLDNRELEWNLDTFGFW